MGEIVPLNRPITYKGYIIEIKGIASKRYEFTICELVEMKLSGTADNLTSAIGKARNMIDQLVGDKNDRRDEG